MVEPVSLDWWLNLFEVIKVNACSCATARSVTVGTALCVIMSNDNAPSLPLYITILIATEIEYEGLFDDTDLFISKHNCIL